MPHFGYTSLTAARDCPSLVEFCLSGESLTEFLHKQINTGESIFSRRILRELDERFLMWKFPIYACKESYRNYHHLSFAIIFYHHVIRQFYQCPRIGAWWRHSVFVSTVQSSEWMQPSFWVLARRREQSCFDSAATQNLTVGANRTGTGTKRKVYPQGTKKDRLIQDM